jgi:hypothetical protein
MSKTTTQRPATKPGNRPLTEKEFKERGAALLAMFREKFPTPKPTFEEWILNAPHFDQTETVNLPITLNQCDWFWLVQGAAANKKTIAEMVEWFIEEGCSGGVCELSNNEYRMKDYAAIGNM